MQQPGTPRWRRPALAALAAAGGALLAGGWGPAVHPEAVPCLSGFVRDPGGRAVANGDLDFFIAGTGTKLFTRGDNTDAFGFYNVCVLPNVYDVTYAPPVGTRLMGKVVPGLNLDAARELDVVLEFGSVVSGRVTGPAGEPLGGVDADVDRLGGGRIFTPDDKSADGTGAYRVVIPDGAYRMRFEPPPGTRWQGLQIDSVTVSGDATVDAVLQPGVLLSGRVRDAAGAGVPDVDLDLRWLDTGRKQFVANNTTDEQGDYVVAVPAGDFDLRFVPPPGTRFVGVRIDSFAVRADAQFDAVLPAGVVITATVRDSLGNPIDRADLDVVREATGLEVFLPNDATDARGEARVAVLPDVYRIEFNPPPGTAFDRVVLRGVPVRGDTAITAVLPERPRVRVTGRVTDAAGAGIAATKFTARLPSGADAYIPNDVADATGAFDLSVPIGTYDLLVAPPRGSRSVGLRLAGFAVARDTTLGVLQLEDGVLVTARVTDGAGAPVAAADLDFRDTVSGAEAYTPHDNTDAGGVALVALRPGRWDVEAGPPAGSLLAPARVAGVEVRADTTLVLVLARSGTPPGTAPVARFGTIAPNPFHGATTIRYSVRAPTSVRLCVYDAAGRLVRTLEEGSRPAAEFERTWDGTDGRGTRVPSGVYLVSLETPRNREIRKALLVR